MMKTRIKRMIDDSMIEQNYDPQETTRIEVVVPVDYRQRFEILFEGYGFELTGNNPPQATAAS